MKKEIRIGLLAALAITILIGGFKFLKGKDVFNRNQTFLVEYKDANNVTVSTPVYIHGFQVGIIKDIYLSPKNMESIIIELEVAKNIKVPKWAVAEIIDVGLMGNKAVNLQFKGMCQGNDCANSGDYLVGRTRGMLSSIIGDPHELDLYMTQLKVGISGILDTVNYYFKNADKSTGLGLAVNNIQNTLQNLEKITNQFNILLQASNKQLQGTFSNLNSITGNINSKNKEISDLLSNLNDISVQIKGAEIDKTLGVARTTLTSANDRIEDLDKTINEANEAINKISRIVTKVDNGSGSLGKLINDNDLYNNIERLSKQADLLVQDLRLNPKRYVNVSIIGRKQKTYTLPANDPAEKVLQITTEPDSTKISPEN